MDFNAELNKQIIGLKQHILNISYEKEYELFTASLALLHFLGDFFNLKNLEWNGFTCDLSLLEVQSICDSFCEKVVSLTTRHSDDDFRMYIKDLEQLFPLGLFIELPDQIFEQSMSNKSKYIIKVWNFFRYLLPQSSGNTCVPIKVVACRFDDLTSNTLGEINYFLKGPNTLELTFSDIQKVRGTRTSGIEFCNCFIQASCTAQLIWKRTHVIQGRSNPFNIVCNVSQKWKAQAVLFWYHMTTKRQEDSLPNVCVSPEKRCAERAVPWSTLSTHLSYFCRMETGVSLVERVDKPERLLGQLKNYLFRRHKHANVNEPIKYELLLTNGSSLRRKRQASAEMEESIKQFSFWQWFYSCLKCLGKKETILKQLWSHGLIFIGPDNVVTEQIIRCFPFTPSTNSCLIRFSLTNLDHFVVAYLDPDSQKCIQWEPRPVSDLEANRFDLIANLMKMNITHMIGVDCRQKDFHFLQESNSASCNPSATLTHYTQVDNFTVPKGQTFKLTPDNWRDTSDQDYSPSAPKLFGVSEDVTEDVTEDVLINCPCCTKPLRLVQSFGRVELLPFKTSEPTLNQVNTGNEEKFESIDLDCDMFNSLDSDKSFEMEMP